MRSKIEELKKTIHQISDKVMVIDRTFESFYKSNSVHRLNDIAKTNIDSLMELVKKSKSLSDDLEDQLQSSVSNAEFIKVLKSWYLKKIDLLSDYEKSYSLKIKLINEKDHQHSYAKGNQESKLNESDRDTIHKQLDEILTKAFSYLQAIRATEVTMDLVSKHGRTKLTLTDNSQEAINLNSFEMQGLKNLCLPLNAKLNITSFDGIGNTISLIF